MFVVIARPDMDCDGFSTGFHRVVITPAEKAEVSAMDDHTRFIGRMMHEDRAGFYDDPSACYVLHPQEFYDECYSMLDSWHKSYFRRVGYASSGLNGSHYRR